MVLAAGVNQRQAGESHLDLLSRNAEIFAEIVPAVLAAEPILSSLWRPIRSTL